MKAILIILFLGVVSFFGFSGLVNEDQALAAVKGWLHKTPNPLENEMSHDIQDIVSYEEKDGMIQFYVVNLKPSGFVIISADDYIEPILAFSSTGYFDFNSQSPFFSILRFDINNRIRHIKKIQEDLIHTSKAVEPSTVVIKAKEKWLFLLGELDGDGKYFEKGLANIDDPRVDALLDSEWGQGYDGGGYCYNYFTPNHYVCGCVATAMAQLMRYHEYPQNGIGVHTYNIEIDGTGSTAYTRGGDGAGGAYDWNLMPLDPPENTPDDQRQMIGSLTYDAGISVNMSYSASSSGTDTRNAADAFRDRFLFDNAVKGSDSLLTNIDSERLYRMVNPNLEAGLPVLLQIRGGSWLDPHGHAVVCDGYGFNTLTMYHHLNMGWYGNEDDIWYNLPNVETTQNDYDEVPMCVYNIFPVGTGEILSGRVTDDLNNPIQGVLVSAGGITDYTNDRGIYALVHLQPGTYTVTAQKEGYDFTDQIWTVESSVDYGAVGNLWGIDFPPQGIYKINAEGLIVDEWGIVDVSVHAPETNDYYVRVWDDDGITYPEWDWLNYSSEEVTLGLGENHTFQLNVRPLDMSEAFEFWLYKKDLLGLYQVIDKVEVTLFATECMEPGLFNLLSPSNGLSLPANSTNVTLSWDESSNADSYDVYFGTSPNPDFYSSVSEHSATVPVANGMTYYWRIVARTSCNSGYSTSSETRSFSIETECIEPGPFSLVSPNNGLSMPANSMNVTLYWNDASNSDSYDVYFGTSSNPEYHSTVYQNSTMVPVANGITYYWRIVARTSCNSGYSTSSDTWSFSIQTGHGEIIASASPNPVPLNDPSTISIQVNDGSGNPVGAGHTVTCSTQYTGLFSGNNASSMYSPSSVLTDSNGQTWIRFTSWTPGTAQITVDCEGASTIVPITFEEPQPGDYDLDILVSYDGGTSTYSEYSIAVLVKDLATGTPVSGVSVHLTSIPPELIDEYDTTDANGVASYILTVNESGDVTLTAEAGNNQESTTFYAQVGSGPPPPTMDPLATYSIGGDGAGVCFSPDGTTLVAAGEGSSDVYAWNTSNWSSKWHQYIDSNVWGQIDVSPDSSKVLVAADNGPEILTNSKTLSSNAPDLPLAEEAVLAHWRDNSVYYYTTETALYSSASSSPLYTLPNDDTFELESHLDYTAANGGRLTAGTLDGYVYVWNTSGGVVFSDWLDNTCVDTVFSPDGSKLAVTWESPPTVKVFRTSDWQVINMPSVTFGNVFGACFIDNGTKLAVGGNSTIVIFDLTTNQQFRSADVSGEVIEFSWNESIQKLAAGSSADLIYVFSPLSSDGIDPVINVTHPPEGYVTNMASLTTTGRVTDNVGVTTFTINGTNVSLDGSGNFSHSVGLSAGENTITYYAADAMNNSSTVTRHVNRVTDQTPPVISNVSVTPDSGIVGTFFTIQCDVQDGDSGVASVTAVVTGGNGPFSVALNLDSGYTYTGQFDSSNAIPGYYLVDIEAVDSSPNANSRIVEDAAGLFVNAPCVYSIDPTSASFGPAGGSDTISVTTTSGCSWTATEQLDWVTITSGAAGTGNGTVAYTVAANGASSPRQGTISIAGQFCTISQEGYCTYQVTPTQSTVAAAGDDVIYTVTTDPECSWVVVEDVSWLNVLQGLSGTGNGTVLVEVLPNPAYTERQGQFSIAGTPVGITQLGQTQPGDLDGDGQIGASDLQLLADFLANNLSIQTLEADFNSDLRIDAVDLEILIQYLGGNITEIPFVNEETIIYEEDFTTDPQYSTAFPDDCYWDSVNGWYYARVHDVSTDYGHYYGDSPLFGPVAAGQSFHCEFDFNIVLQDWGSYPGVFLRNSLATDPWSPVPWYFNFFWADSTYKKFWLRDTSSAHVYESGTVTQDCWYHVTVDYDAVGQLVDLIVTDLSTGSTFWELYDQPFVITEPFDMLTIGQRTTPPAYGDISIILVDDILISR